MNAHAVTYPSLQRRLIAHRRSRALFLRRTTQQVRSNSLLHELGRAAICIAGIALWGALLVMLAA